jgi:phage repressor protein C with HTH and peptisase S24 domain
MGGDATDLDANALNEEEEELHRGVPVAAAAAMVAGEEGDAKRKRSRSRWKYVQPIKPKKSPSFLSATRPI